MLLRLFLGEIEILYQAALCTVYKLAVGKLSGELVVLVLKAADILACQQRHPHGLKQGSPCEGSRQHECAREAYALLHLVCYIRLCKADKA